MTHDARAITVPKPPVGAVVVYHGSTHTEPLGRHLAMVTRYLQAYPNMVALTTERELPIGGMVLADPAGLTEPEPADAWDVHVLQALTVAAPTSLIAHGRTPRP